MTRWAGRVRLWMVCGLVALTATACFQNIDEEANPNALSMGLPTATVTPFPTETETAPPYEPIIDETAIALAQETLSAQSAEDLLLSDTGGFATETPFEVAQIDDFSLTSTVFVANVTETAAFSATQTAIAAGLGATETATEFPTNDPGFGTPIFTPTNGFGGSPGVCIHVVQIGDNLFRMSLTYGVSVNDLAVANGITNIQMIYVNQEITIPGCGTTGVYPPPTLQPAFDSSGVGGFGTPEAPGGQTSSICNQHLVQQYQTLFQISMLYGVPIQSIANANGITNVNNITMATTLQIPCA